MLQRAASNAYSWWWASHIRTKQSKWLDTNLQEMEEKVKSALNLIEEEADTFAKKAEMYYQRRPELINFIRESYRSYRALAERYDHLSGELHKANNTIATVCPEQVHFGIEEEEDISSESGKSDANKVQKVLARNQQISLKRSTKPSSTQTKPQHRRTSSLKSVDQAQEEIDKLQKGILALQTEKEFVKGSYESSLAKYLDIEKRITEMQERVSSLQDEYSASIIEDDDARALMIATALRSCEDTLVKLHEQQKKSTEDARFESQRIKSASEKLKELKCNDGHLQVNIQDSSLSASKKPSSANDISGNEAAIFDQERIELNPLYETIRNNLKNTSEMSAIALAEKIDGLVNKVISLETTVSSQTAQIESLRCETDGFYKYLQSLEEEKSLIVDSKASGEKLRHAEEELHAIQELEKSIQEEGDKLKTHFMKIYHTFHNLSSRLQCPGQRIDLEAIDSAGADVENECLGQKSLNLPETMNSENKPEEETREPNEKDATVHGITENVHEQQNEQKIGDEEQLAKDPAPSEFNEANGEVIKTATSHEGQECTADGKQQHEGKDQAEASLPNWQQLFLDGLEDREKILLAEYTSVLRKYRETRQKLAEVDKKHQDHVFQTVAQMRNLRNAFVTKDEENRCLRRKLSFLESGRKRGSFVISETVAHDSSQSTALPSMVPDLPNSRTSVDLVDSTKEDCKSLLDLIGEQYDALPIEEKFRRDIDTLLDENLDFWLRFSSSFQQIQMYRLTIEKLQTEIMKVNDNRLSSYAGGQPTNPEPSSIHKQLKELQADLSIWIEQNALLKEELQRRCCSLSDISEEITRASKEGREGDGLQFTAYLAAKFKGEVVNMQQENNKVAKELQVGLEQVRGLQSVLEKALAKLDEGLQMQIAPRAYDQQQLPNLSGKAKIPLRSFLFGVKTKPKKSSIFSCMNYALQKQYIDLRPGLPS